MHSVLKSHSTDALYYKTLELQLWRVLKVLFRPTLFRVSESTL